MAKETSILHMVLAVSSFWSNWSHWQKYRMNCDSRVDKAAINVKIMWSTKITNAIVKEIWCTVMNSQLSCWLKWKHFWNLFIYIYLAKNHMIAGMTIWSQLKSGQNVHFENLPNEFRTHNQLKSMWRSLRIRRRKWIICSLRISLDLSQWSMDRTYWMEMHIKCLFDFYIPTNCSQQQTHQKTTKGIQLPMSQS